VIGVDAIAANLRQASRLSGRKAARGGTPNALFGRLALEQAPGALAAIADRLTVYLPWGSLLRAVALPDPALIRLRGLCKTGAHLHIVFGYTDSEAMGALGLPPLDPPVLEAGYRRAGLAVKARRLSPVELRALPTTWAHKLAFGKDRPFVELTGAAE
jgi:16S rRNA (adenine(1408)-N(1))-methyltransferase